MTTRKVSILLIAAGLLGLALSGRRRRPPSFIATAVGRELSLPAPIRVVRG